MTTNLLLRLPGVAVTAIAALFVIVAATAGARAQCAAQDLDGTFRNVDPSTRAVTRIRLTFRCRDTGRRTGPVVWVEVWGKCHPRDCYWGKVPGRARWNRTLHQYTKVQARFRLSFAVKTVVFLRVDRRTARMWHYTRFTDGSGRRNYFRWDTLRK